MEGKNILLEERSAEGHPERLSELARDFAAIKVDAIVAPAVAAGGAARQATNSIPIVMVHAGDPVGAGLMASLARPGGNVTGTMNLSYAGKQVELMHELAPRAANLAILLNPTNAGARTYVIEAMEAGRRFNLHIAIAEVARIEDFKHAFALIRDMRADGLLVMGDPLIGDHRAEVFAFAASTRLPAIYDPPHMARYGGLVAYGPLIVEHYVAAAGYVDKILKGARPTDLPVEQPTKIRTRSQFEDRESARPNHSPVADRAGERCNSMIGSLDRTLRHAETGGSQFLSPAALPWACCGADGVIGA